MRFDSIADFLEMGGHAPFVFAVYGIAVVVIGLNLIMPFLRVRKNLLELKAEKVSGVNQS